MDMNRKGEQLLFTESLKSDEILQCLDIVDKQMIVSVTDSNGIIQIVSDAFCEISGYTREELIGQAQNIVRHPDTSPDTFEELWKTIQDGKQWQGELKNRKKDGHSYWVITTIFPRFTSDNTIVGYVSIRQDITSSKELLEQEEIFKEQSKNASMGEMIGLIAHQWMQPLSVISITTANAEIEMTLDGIKEKNIKKTFERINKSVNYLAKTVNDFRNFFKVDNNKISVSIEELLKYSIDIINPIIQEKRINLIFDSSIIENKGNSNIITASRNDLVQVILNIIKNSSDALLSNRIKNPYIEIKLNKKENMFVLEFSDNAGGIPEEYISYIFNNNFSTKGEQGTGLGLYMSKMITEKRLKGSLEVHNNKDGACFHVILPMAS